MADRPNLTGISLGASSTITIGEANLYRGAPLATQTGVAHLRTDGVLTIQNSGVGNGHALKIGVTGETVPRFVAQTDGSLNWGDGATYDTALHRSTVTAGQLNCDGPLQALGEFRSWHNTAAQMRMANNGGAATLYFGSASDVNLYRGPTAELVTNTYFYAAGLVTANNGTAGKTQMGVITGGFPGVLFGTAGDTNLYRVSAANLKTDVTLISANIDIVAGTGGYGNIYVPAAGAFVGQSGSGTAVPIRASAFTTVSDQRLKFDIEPVEPKNALELISALRCVEYAWEKGGPREYGVLAQEVQKVIPSMVFGGEDEDAMMAVDYGRFAPLLIEAIKLQQAQIEALQKAVDQRG